MVIGTFFAQDLLWGLTDAPAALGTADTGPVDALLEACAAANVPVVPVPGPCAAVAALSVAGIPDSGEFVFSGFIPRANRARRSKVAEIVSEHRAVVIYEAPHRMLDTLGDLSAEGAGGRGTTSCSSRLTPSRPPDGETAALKPLI